MPLKVLSIKRSTKCVNPVFWSHRNQAISEAMFYSLPGFQFLQELAMNTWSVLLLVLFFMFIYVVLYRPMIAVAVL